MINLQVTDHVDGKGKAITVEVKGNANELLKELTVVTHSVLSRIVNGVDGNIDDLIEMFTKGLKVQSIKEQLEKDDPTPSDIIIDVLSMVLDAMDE